MKQFFFSSTFTGNKAFNIAWLLFRFYTGITIAIGAGWPKMNQILAPGWFVEQVSKLGFTFPSPAFWAGAAAWGEFVGGLCIAVGFFTRFSAMQLAFQFFVISFIWYEEPLPMFGMYYQQLLFWAFVLISVAGSGKYGIDSWIIHRKKIITAKHLTSAFGIAALLIALSSFAQKPSPTLKPAELNLLRGTWKGTLTYKDYTSDTQEIIPVTIYGWRKGNENTSRTWRLKFEYDNEPKANNSADYEISKDHRKINDAVIIEKQTLADGSLKVVTEKRGEDGNDHKPCTIRTIIQLKYNTLIITKLVKFDGESDFFQRNEYKVTR
jgi:uncharacterized membrane protein YphA (DoxX/SURF4 family)